MRGLFISMEGGDGSGKSTQLDNIKKYFAEKGMESVFTREPGGTEISEKIRDIILDPENSEMNDMTEALLYAASRAQHVAEKIKPSLESGKNVICDRFVDSSIVYQGIGRNIGDAVRVINGYAISGCLPDITIFLDISPENAMARISNRGHDRLEREDLSFHQRIYEGYKKLVANDETGRLFAVDANRSPEEVWVDIKLLLDERISNIIDF